MTGLDDINDDSTPDFAVCSELNRVHIYSGAGGNLIDIIPGQNGSHFGRSLSSLGDVDGDGVGELVVGAPGFTLVGTPCGRAFVYSGSTRDLIWSTLGGDDADLGYDVAGIGDLNGDGYDDVIISARVWQFGLDNPGRVQVHSGIDGDLLKVIHGNQDATRFGSSVADIGDVTADGVPDLLIGHEQYNIGIGAAYVFSGEPTPEGSIQTANMNGSLLQPGVALAVDLDDDQAAEFICISREFGRMTVRRNFGDGTFMPAAYLFAGAGPSDAVAVDFDRDNDQDVIVTLEGERRVVVFSNVQGSLVRTATVNVGRRPCAVVSADFDGNNWMDLAVANRQDHTLTVLLQDSPSFANPQVLRFRTHTLPLSAEPTDLYAARLDNNGSHDLLVFSKNTDNVAGLLNRGDGRFRPERFSELPDGALHAVTGRFDGDNLADLAWFDGETNQVIVRRGLGNGRFGAALLQVECEETPRALRVANINHHGGDDLLLSLAASDAVRMLLIGSDVGEPLEIVTQTVSSPRWMAAGDLDQDADHDVAVVSDDGEVSMLINLTMN